MFSEKLVEARKNKCLTQDQLAEKLYVTRQAVSRWERGTAEPDLQTLARLCHILGVSAEYFIGTDSAAETVLFKNLPWNERHEYFWQFAATQKAKQVFVSVCGFLTIMSLCGIIFLSVRLILYNYGLVQYRINVTLIIALIAGLFVFNLLFAGLCIYLKIIISAQFNRWLYGRNILRTSKIL